MTEEKDLTPEEAARAEIKAIHDDGFAEINGREYHFSKMTHGQRRKVFAYYSTVGQMVKSGNYGFMSTPEFAEVEKIVLAKVLFDGVQISKIEGHFEEYPQDYVTFINTTLTVISYPFFSGNHTS
jgi:hypothetical protein